MASIAKSRIFLGAVASRYVDEKGEFSELNIFVYKFLTLQRSKQIYPPRTPVSLPTDAAVTSLFLLSKIFCAFNKQKLIIFSHLPLKLLYTLPPSLPFPLN